MGACVAAAAALLSRAAEDGRRVVPRADLDRRGGCRGRRGEACHAVGGGDCGRRRRGRCGRCSRRSGRYGRRRCGGRCRRTAGAAGAGLGQVFATARDDVVAEATAAIGLSLGPTANDSVTDAAALRRRAASHCTACMPQPRRARRRRHRRATATPASATAGRPGGQLCLLELGRGGVAGRLARAVVATRLTLSPPSSVNNVGGLPQVLRRLQQQPCSSLPGVLF